MKILIIYASRHGSTKKAVYYLKEKITHETVIVNLKKESVPDMGSFDAVIIGGSIHAGQLQSKVKNYCTDNKDKLLKTDLGLFICHMEEGEKATKELADVYPEELLNHAKATGLFGGEFIFEKMNFLERMIIKKISGLKESVSKINYETIQQFANSFN